ncbi:MAG: tetratricopeptide repeat protein [Elusimicrobia bacterium]|nr:tetratricopeptide repeat protein [Elusimicrobiota bacterium]
MSTAGKKIIFFCLAPACLAGAGLVFAATGQKPANPSEVPFQRPLAHKAAPLKRAKELQAAGPSDSALDTAIAALKKNPSDKDLYLHTLELLPETPVKAGPQQAGVTKQTMAFKIITFQVLEKDKDYYGYYLGLCKIHRNGGETQAALSNCRKAMELDATPYPVYREFGLTWAKAGNKSKAEEMLSQGVELSSDNCKAYLSRAAVREQFGETKTALADYIKALALLKKNKSAGQGLDTAFINAKIKKLSQPAPGRKIAGSQKPQAVSAPPSGQQVRTVRVSAADAEKCARTFRSELAAGNLEAAERSSGACLKLTPSDPELCKDRAGLLIRLGHYEDAVKEYNRAAELYKNSPMAAFCLVKKAETLIKLGREADAEKAYVTALKTSPADLTALNGLAGIFETRGDLKSASGVYEKILSAEPGNARARSRLAEIEAGLTLPEQALAALKERQAVDLKKTSPAPEDLKLFKDITVAERNGAVDYLKMKNHALNGLVLEKQSGKGPKLFLTGAGYRLYLSYLSRDAVAFFEAQPMTLRDVFALRDNSGAPLFDKAGKLTAEGDAALRLAKSGKKSWLLIYEAVPASPQAEKTNKEIEAALKEGYREISEPEYLWLAKATTCPEETLTEEPTVIMKIIKMPTYRRYFLCSIPDTSLCSMKGTTKLAIYIENYRRGDTHIPEGETSTAFFGSGAIKQRHFCEKGKIWMGD